MAEGNPSPVSGNYVEHAPIFLPRFQSEDGFELKLGSLFNCKSSKVVKNLISKKHGEIEEEFLAAIPRRTFDYKLTHVKSTKDKITSTSIGLDATLTVLFGIKLNIGSANYSNSIQSSFTSEEIQLHYSQDNYVIRLLPSYFADPEDALDIPEDATHIVTEVIVGAEIISSLRFEDVRTTELETSSSSGLGGLVIGPISSGVKAGLSALASAPGNSSSLEIIFESTIGKHQTPDSVESMFTLIDNIDTDIKEVNEFTQLKNGKAYGNAIKYLLLPIAHFIKNQEPKAPKYQVIENEILQEFLTMIQTLMDYTLEVPEEETRKITKDQTTNSFVGKKIVYADSRLKPILFDSKSQFSQQVCDVNTKVKSKAVELYDESKNTFEKYKDGSKNIEDIKSLIAIYREAFLVFEDQIENFISTGKSLLSIIKADDVDPSVKAWFMFSEEKLCEWKQKVTNIKILLTINYEKIILDPSTRNAQFKSNVSIPFGTLKRLYQMSKHFPDGTIGILLLPLPSEEMPPSFTLDLLIGDSTTPIETDQFIWTLDIIQTAYGVDLGNNRVYYHYLGVTAFNSDDQIILPLKGENLAKQLPKFMELAKQYREINFFENIIPFRNENIKEVIKQENSYLIITTTDGLNSINERIDNFNELRHEMTTKSNYTNISCSWGVTTFGLSFYQDAPQLFLFHNNNLIGTCFDKLDIWLLKYIWSKFDSNEAPGQISKFLLSPSMLKNSFYPEKIEFSLKTQQILQPNFSDDSAINSFSISTMAIGYNPIPSVQRTLKLLESLIGVEKTEVEFLGALTSNTLANLNESDKDNLLVLTMRKNFWQESTGVYDFPKDQLVESNWKKKLFSDFLDYIFSLSEFLSRAGISYLILESYLNDEIDQNDKIKILPVLQSFIGSWRNHLEPELREAMHNLIEKIKPEDVDLETAAEIMDMILNKVISIDYVWKDESKWDLFQLFLTVVEIRKTNPQRGLTITFKHSILQNYLTRYKLLGNQDIGSMYSTLLPKLYELQLDTWFSNLRSLMSNGGAIANQIIYFEKLNELALTTVQKTFLWQNPKFINYVQIGLEEDENDDFIQLLVKLEAPDNNIPIYIPSPIATILLKYIQSKIKSETDFPLWKTEWRSLDDALLVFQSLVAYNLVPETFGNILRNNINTNIELTEQLKSIGALFYWSESDHLFLEPWDIETLVHAVKLILNHQLMIASKEVAPVNLNLEPEIFENNKILTIVQNYGPQFLRKRITLHGWSKATGKQFNTLWTTDLVYKEVMECFFMILMFSPDHRRLELNRLSTVLTQLSSDYSFQFEKLAEEIIINIHNLKKQEIKFRTDESTEKIQSLQNQLQQIYKHYTLMSLGKVYLYREVQCIFKLYKYHGIYEIPSLQQFPGILREEFLTGQKLDFFDPFRKYVNSVFEMILDASTKRFNIFILSFVGLAGADKTSILTSLFQSFEVQPTKSKVYSVRQRGVTIQLYGLGENEKIPKGYDGFLILDFEDFYGRFPELSILKYPNQNEFEIKLLSYALAMSDLVIMAFMNDDFKFNSGFIDLLNVSFVESGKQKLAKSPDIIFIQRQSNEYTDDGNVEKLLKTNFNLLNESIVKMDYDLGLMISTTKLFWNLFRRIENKTLLFVLQDSNINGNIESLRQEIQTSANKVLTLKLPMELKLGNWFKSAIEGWSFVTSNPISPNDISVQNLEISNQNFKDLRVVKQKLDETISFHKAECIRKLKFDGTTEIEKQIKELKIMFESIEKKCSIGTAESICNNCTNLIELMDEIEESNPEFSKTKLQEQYTAYALNTYWNELYESIYIKELNELKGLTDTVHQCIADYLKHSNRSSNSRMSLIQEIYKEIRGRYSSKQAVISWKRKFSTDIKEEYARIPFIIKSFENEPKPNELKTYGIPNGELIKRKIDDEVSNQIITDSYHGIIRKFKNKLDILLDRKEKMLALPFEFIWNAHSYGLSKLFQRISDYEEQWVKANGIKVTLEKFKKEIEQEIGNRLDSSKA